MKRALRMLPAGAKWLFAMLGCSQCLAGASLVELEYSAAPPDNPLKGLVPYVSATGRNRFPHSMEFCYIPLKDLMKEPGEFDWDPLEEVLAGTGQRGNQLIFRVYCEFPGKGVAIPTFLVDSGVGITSWTRASDGKLSHTPDYGDKRLREALPAFIEALGDRYDGDARVAFITAGLLGSWGEWHTHPRRDLWAGKPVQREVMDAYAAAFDRTPVLLRYPAGPDSSLHADNHARPFGYHDDSFCWATLDTGRAGDSWFFEPSLKAAGAGGKWKSHPIGGEIRPELWTRSFTADRHPRDQGFVECVERTHVTWLMDSGLFSLRIPLDRERRRTALRQVARMGYELHVSRAEWRQGKLSLHVENLGVAPFYHDWPVEIEEGGVVRGTSWKLGGILPGETRIWTTDLAGPGQPKVRIRVPNPMPGGKPLRFANRSQGKNWLTIRP